MNIVKLQNDLKDLSDQQLLSSMQMGSAPQYLVLAEMQRRKKLRDEAASPEQQQQGTVADEIISGIAQLPMQAPQMASGGLVSFAEGGRGEDKDKEDDKDWRYYKPNAGVFGKTDTPLMMLNPQYWSNYLQDMQGVPREEWRGQGGPGVLAYAKGGYLQGEADACWKNPETGEQMCPPSKPNVEYPETGQRKKMSGGGIVALQAGGTPSEARMMLANMGVDTTGMSDDEVMNIAATRAGVMAPNIDVAEPTPDTGFSPVPATEAPLPPVSTPEAAPPAQSGFMDTITSGITSLLGIGGAKAEEATPAPLAVEAPQPIIEYPVPTTAQMEDPTQARQWLSENAPAWYDPSKRSDKQVLEDIKPYAPGGYREGQKQREDADGAVREARRQAEADAAAQRKEDRMALQPRQPALAGTPEVRQFQEETTQAQTQEEREAAARRLTEAERARQAQAKAEREKGRTVVPYPGSGAKKTEQGAAAGPQYDKPLPPTAPEGLEALISDPTMERYYQLLGQEKELKDKSNINRYLMELGLRMAAGKSPDFLTNLAEAGVGTLESAGKMSEEERKREEAIRDEISKLLYAREVSLAKAETADLTQLARIEKSIENERATIADVVGTSKEERDAAQKRLDQLLIMRNNLYKLGGSQYSDAARQAAAAATMR